MSTPFQNLTGLYCTLLHRDVETEGQIVRVYGRLLEIQLVEDRKLTTFRHYGELPVQVWNVRSCPDLPKPVVSLTVPYETVDKGLVKRLVEVLRGRVA